MKRTPLLAIALASVVLVTACSDDKTATKTTTAAAGTTASAGTTATAGTTAASGSAAPGGDASAAGDPYCAKVKEYQDASSAVGDALNESPLDKAKVAAAYKNLENLMEGMKADAPDSIKAEVATVLGATVSFYDLLQKNEFDFAKLDANAADKAAYEAITGNTLFEQASNKLEEFSTTTCDLTS